MGLTSLEICAGAGGMALGLHRAGIEAVAMVEREAAPCATLRAEVASGRLAGEVIEADMRSIDYRPFRGRVGLACGGVPCQPFSQAGQRKGADDERDGWPTAIRVMDEVRPCYGLWENVRGMLSESFAAYRDDIQRQIEALGYSVRWRLLNAANFGVPQRRLRVFLLATREDCTVPRWPAHTHSKGGGMFLPPWVEAGESVGIPGLWTLAGNPSQKEIDGHYTGRARWSQGPCGTVKGDGWSHAYRQPDGSTGRAPWQWRAAWQTFPADWRWQGSQTAIDRQIGNAVPPLLAEAIGREIVRAASL